MKTGTVRFYNELSKYGFITVDGHYITADGFTAKDIFVHESGLTCPINNGDKVSFEIGKGRKGLQATNVKQI